MDKFPKDINNTECSKVDITALGSKGKMRGIQRQPCVSTQSPVTAKRVSGNTATGIDTRTMTGGENDSKMPLSMAVNEAVDIRGPSDPPMLFNRTVSDGVTQMISARSHKDLAGPPMPMKTVTFLEEPQDADVRLKRLCRTPTPYSGLDSQPSHDEDTEGEAHQNTHSIVRHMKSAPANLDNP